MRRHFFAALFAVLLLAITMSCGGNASPASSSSPAPSTSTANPAPNPAPAPPSTPTPTPPPSTGGGSSGSGGSGSGGSGGSGSGSGSPAAAAQYLYVANANSQDISAFQVTSEGTLTAVSGSPFAAGNSFLLALAPGGGNSLAVSASQLQGWSVDPATGAITKASTAPPPSTAELVPNSTRSLVYEVEVDPCNSGHCTDLGVSAVNNGAVTRVQSSFSMTPPQKNPQRIALDPSGHFLYTTAIAYGLGNFLGILRLGTDGHIAAQVSADTQICSSMDIAATASGSHTYVYVTCSSGGIQMAVVDNTSGAVLNTTSFATGGKAEGLAVDPSGQYLLVADTSVNTVDIFKIDPATGKLGNAFTQIPAGMSPNVLTFDSAGKFVYVANGSCLVLPPATCPNDGASGLQAYSWTGSTLNALGSYSTGTNPVSLAVWKP